MKGKQFRFLSGEPCLCLPGWTGELCDTDIDECATSPCLVIYKSLAWKDRDRYDIEQLLTLHGD